MRDASEVGNVRFGVWPVVPMTSWMRPSCELMALRPRIRSLVPLQETNISYPRVGKISETRWWDISDCSSEGINTEILI